MFNANERNQNFSTQKNRSSDQMQSVALLSLRN